MKKLVDRRRFLLVFGCIVAAVVLVVATWLVATRFQSPAQRQASAEPPPPGPVVVAAVRGDLVEQTTVMAGAVREGNRSVALPLGSGVSVVTKPGVEVERSLGSGGVIAWVNDSPVFALEGQFPLFRDVGVGDSGQDVAMLQQALAGMGYEVSADGEFGAYTADCFRQLYQSVGAEVPTREITEAPAAAQPAKEGQSGAQPAAPAAPKREIVVPMADFVVISGLPVTVTSIPPVGSVLSAENAKMELAGERIVVTANVPGSVAVQLSPGLLGSVDNNGEAIGLKIASVAPAKDPAVEEGAEDEAAAGMLSAMEGESVVTFASEKTAIPNEWVGRKDILVTLDLVEPITDVLLIPDRAIATDSAGKDNVLVQSDDGSFAQVTVVSKGCVSGLCAIDDVAGISEGSNLRVDR